MADAASSGDASDLEKENTPTEFDHEGDQGVITEETSLLRRTHRRSTTYGGFVAIEVPHGKDTMITGHSLPSVVYASPARPHLPSPSASNSRVTGTSPLSRKLLMARASDTRHVFTVQLADAGYGSI